MKQKKFSFLLLEALIAISILIVFAPLLMRLPIHHYKAQVEYFEKLEKQRIADWTYSEIKETLLRQSIPWKALPEKEKGTKTFPLSDTKLHLRGLKPKTINRSFTLKCKGEKEGNQGEIFRLYKLKIRIEDSLYEYLLLIQLV